MPINYKEYHPKWTLIVRLIRRRSGNRCELCGIENHSVIRKSDRKTPGSQEWDMYHSLIKNAGHNAKTAMKRLGWTKIILTTAHMDHNKLNNLFSNLRHLCQRCHLKHDIHQHAANRTYGRNYNRGHQGTLF